MAVVDVTILNHDNVIILTNCPHILAADMAVVDHIH